MTAPFAIDLRNAETFPTRRVEDWKWSDLRKFLRAAPEPSPALAVAPGGPFAALGGEEIAFGNGRDSAGASEVGYVARGRETLRLRFVTDASGTGHQARATVEVEAGAALLLLETYEGSGSAYVANAGLSLKLGKGARLTRIVLLDDQADALSISAAEVALSEGAVFEQTVLASGARLQRHETRVAHPGHGASVRLDGLYVLGGERHADLTTVVEHAGVGGETRQLTKGVVSGRARGVFQGRIVVAHGADKTDARMGHHALILSDRAEVDAKPELEIYADDVACAHGNTIGALDENALFYARARGIPEPEARAMLTEAFLGEVLDRIEDERVREFARGWLGARLEALS
ncbi:MAG: Fe-S cluster assembly protein SufD [Proteobacteria bacterium]|nr:Fe-S cluster assembly protein SufD [Pseudomonadota bacterium]